MAASIVRGHRSWCLTSEYSDARCRCDLKGRGLSGAEPEPITEPAAVTAECGHVRGNFRCIRAAGHTEDAGHSYQGIRS